MNWPKAIAQHRDSVLALVATMVQMAALITSDGVQHRATYFKILRLLRIAESATRRLIVIAAWYLPKPKITLRQTPQTLPDFSAWPSGTASGTQAFKLFDTPKRFTDVAPPSKKAAIIPHIRNMNDAYCAPIEAQTKKPMPAFNHAKFNARIAALRGALKSIPEQAKRLIRAQARRSLKSAGPAHMGPMRPGLPPGWRQHNNDEYDQLLRDCHDLTAEALTGDPPNHDNRKSDF